MTFLIIAPYKYSYLLTYLLTRTKNEVMLCLSVGFCLFSAYMDIC